MRERLDRGNIDTQDNLMSTLENFENLATINSEIF